MRLISQKDWISTKLKVGARVPIARDRSRSEGFQIKEVRDCSTQMMKVRDCSTQIADWKFLF